MKPQTLATVAVGAVLMGRVALAWQAGRSATGAAVAVAGDHEIVAGWWAGASQGALADGIDGEHWLRCQPMLRSEACAAVRQVALRWLPADGLQGWALVAQLGATDFLAGVRAPLPTVLAWGPDPQRRPAAARVHAAALAYALGLGLPPSALQSDDQLDGLVLAIEPLRAWYRPEAARRALVDTPPPDRVPLSVVADRVAVGVDPGPAFQHHPGVVLGRVRRGASPPVDSWTTPGLAGLVSLEVASLGRTDLLQPVLDVAHSGPTAADRLAGLYAATRIAPVSSWPTGHPATNRVDALRRGGSP